MHELLESILGDPSLGLTATDRIVLIHLAQYPEGLRVEDIARSTGSRYRWVENEACKLAQLGILRRVAPNTYAINPDFEVRP
jgi:predicted transcriptional regulator